MDGIRQTFGDARRSNNLFVGSIKDNISHTEVAAGVASFIKTILMIQNSTIPKQAGFTSLNTKIAPLGPDRLCIPQNTQSWTGPIRTAVVNNYGAAGSNAAILVQEYAASQQCKALDPEFGVDSPFCLSARSEESLAATCAALNQSLSRVAQTGTPMDLASIAFNLATRHNKRYEHQYSFTASELDSLSRHLDAAITTPSKFHRKCKDSPPVVLCFGGQTGNTATLSRGLFNCCKILRTYLVWRFHSFTKG